MPIILHIADRDLWTEAQTGGSYRADSLATEGLIHFSTPDQIERTANRFYPNRPNLVLLVVDPDKLDSQLRYEESDSDQFPHLYGPLNMDAVIDVVEFPPNEDGTFTLPDAVRRLA